MRKMILGSLIFVMLLTATASAERYLHMADGTADPKAVAYETIPGKVILSTQNDGTVHIEGRVVVKNKLDRPVDYGGYTYVMCRCENPDETVIIENATARPSVVAAGGYSLITFSENVSMDTGEDWEFTPVFSLGEAFTEPVFVGVGDAMLEPHVYSNGVRGYRPLDDLPEGIYQCIMIFGDENSKFLWAEDITINTELNQEASASLEDYEVELFEEYGKVPAYAEITVQRKR